MRYILSLCIGLFLIPIGAASGADPVKVGALLSFSGVYAQIGEEMANAIDLAFEEVGNSVAGRPIKVIRADTEAKPNVALQKAKQLVGSDGVDFLVGPVSSGEGVALRDFIVESKVPLLAPNALATELTHARCSPYIIPIGFSLEQFAKPFAQWLRAQGTETAYTLAPDYVGPRELVEVFSKSFTAAGGKIVGSDYTPFQKTNDFAPYLARVKAARPDVLYVFYAGGEAINFIKQAAAFRIMDSVKLVGPGWTVSPLVLPAQGEAALGFVGALNYAPAIDTAENRKFQQRYRQKYKREASEFGAQAFDAAKFILAGLKATDGKTNDRPALVQAIRAASITGPRGPISIDMASANLVQNMYIVEVAKAATGPGLKIIDTINRVKDEPTACKLQY